MNLSTAIAVGAAMFAFGYLHALATSGGQWLHPLWLFGAGALMALVCVLEDR